MTPPALLELDHNGKDLTPHLAAFLQQHPKLTGIFASTDHIAFTAIRRVHKVSIDVACDPSNIGFDGIKVGQMIEPNFATIATEPRVWGAGASQTILSLIDRSAPPEMLRKEQTFSFRAGGSPMPLRAESKDDEKVAAFSPSNDLTHKKAKIQ